LLLAVTELRQFGYEERGQVYEQAERGARKGFFEGDL
jgi:hypothetical protein